MSWKVPIKRFNFPPIIFQTNSMKELGAGLAILGLMAASMVFVAVIAVIATIFLGASFFAFLWKFNYLTKENMNIFLHLVTIILLIIIAFRLLIHTLKKGIYFLEVIQRQPHFENVVLPDIYEKEKLFLEKKLQKLSGK
jgi:hypothetical protein